MDSDTDITAALEEEVSVATAHDTKRPNPLMLLIGVCSYQVRLLRSQVVLLQSGSEVRRLKARVPQLEARLNILLCV